MDISCEKWIFRQEYVPAGILDNLHTTLGVIDVTFKAACSPQTTRGVTAYVGVRLGAPGTLGARLDALIAGGSR